MADDWDYQLRVYFEDAFAGLARNRQDDPVLAPLHRILNRHDAVLKCQYDAFADYVSEAEEKGPEAYPLYAWTKATIEDPAKEAKYKKSFTLHLEGQEVYDKEKAEALEADLLPLVGKGLISKLTKHDTNPANNPQPPKKYRK